MINRNALCGTSVFVLIALIAATPASSTMIVNVNETLSGDIEVDYSGSLDVRWEFFGPGNPDTITPPRADLAYRTFINTADTLVRAYGGTFLDSDGPMGPGGGIATTVSSRSGDAFGVDVLADDFFVPRGYVSGTFISGTATFMATLAELGIVPGTYDYVIESEDTIRFNVTSSPSTTLPATFPLPLMAAALGGVAGLAARGRRR